MLDPTTLAIALIPLAGRRMPFSSEMTAMTTSNSMSVNAARRFRKP